MTHTLVTILGRARKRDGAPGYEETAYCFPNGQIDQTAFFGLALARYLKPDEIVILGTAGSMWSVLVEGLAEKSGEDEEARLELIDAEDGSNVEQPLLDRLAPLMGRAMDAVVRPTLVPKARDATEQYAILKAVDASVHGQAELDFDLTHGLRHLGMVGFLSSFMLERLRNLNVRGLWYGAWDLREGDSPTPVLRLDGLTHVRRWLDALDRFDASGDYGVFAPLLKEDGVPIDKANCLEDAAFFERTFNVRDAARRIGTFLPALDQQLPGASGLFQHRLTKRLRWVNAGKLSEQQRKLAHQYLKRDDFVRAAIFGREACVSQECEQRGISTLEFSAERKEAVADFEDELKQERGPRKDAYWTLTHLRNALAHGTPPPRPYRPALKNASSLRDALERALNQFFA